MELFDRRSTDQPAVVAEVLSRQDIKNIHSDLQEIKKTIEGLIAIKETVEEMRDIVVAWEDAKSFFRVIKVIGEILKWVVAVGAAVGVIWYFMTGRNR